MDTVLSPRACHREKLWPGCWNEGCAAALRGVFLGCWHHWTSAVTRAFVSHMAITPSARTGQPLQPASINRVLATLGTFARWLGEHRPLLAGDPFAGVKAVATDSPNWRGLTPRQVRRLQMACGKASELADALNCIMSLRLWAEYGVAGGTLAEDDITQRIKG